MTGYVLPLRKYKILEAALAASFFCWNNYPKHTKIKNMIWLIVTNFCDEPKKQ